MNKELDNVTNQYLTFVLDQELYALSIAHVQEVLEYMPITKVPGTQDFMLGVINVRGHAVPVVDLRLKFDLNIGEQTVDTCIIIVEVEIEKEKTTIGALVDGVEEVLELDAEKIEQPPRLGTKIDTEFIYGIGKVEDKFAIVLDIARVFSFAELDAMQRYSSEELEATA